VKPFTLIDAACPVCGSSARRVVGRPGKVNATFERMRQAIEPVRVVRCSGCTATYVSPMIHYSAELRAELYNIGYFTVGDQILELKNMGEKANILAIVEETIGPLGGKRLLDIGCGTGEYLKAASDRGMDVTGIDVDASLTERIHRKLGFRVVTGLFTADTFPRHTFDVIVLSHVIEHLQEPLELLKSIRAALKPGGAFVMCTPNADSFLEVVHNLYGRWRHGAGRSFALTPFTSSYHIVGYNLRSARVVLERAGFQPAYCKVHSGLEWEDGAHRLAMRSLKVLGALLGRGMSIVTVSR